MSASDANVVRCDAKNLSKNVVTWKAVDRWLICLAVFLVATSIIGLAAALAGYFQAPQVLLVAVLITVFYARATREGAQSLPGPTPRWRHILLLVLVALLFRVPAYHYVMGGQDEGVYVNIAHYLQRTGGINVHNDVRVALQDTPYLGLYEASNHSGSAYLPGVYKDDDSAGKLEFQFYHLFPVWMALFIGLFGTTFGVYAQTLFALLSIVFLYRLTLLLTEKTQSALVASGLLALSPLHAFFSKFPVTEIPTLCFSLLGFLLLAVFCASPAQRRGHGWLILSILAFLCVFVTRISGFMYVPFMIALAWIVLLLDRDVVRRRQLQFWAVGITAVYFLSVAYGVIWSSHYSRDIYLDSFRPLFGKPWKAALALLSVGVFVGWFATSWWTRRKVLGGAGRNRLLMLVQWLPTVVVWVSLCLGLLKVYRLGWTEHYAGVGSILRWHLANSGWSGATATSLWMLVVYLGPLLPIAFLVSMLVVRRDPWMLFLRWFAAGFFVYITMLQWIIPYSPYYARYLLSEIVPCMVLLTVCVWSGLGKGWAKRLLSIVMVASLFYGAALSAAQIGKNENAGARASLARIVAPTGPSDLILLDRSPGTGVSWGEVGTSLMYTFGRTVVGVGPSDFDNAGYMAELSSLGAHTFLLMSGPGHPPPGYRYVASSQFRVMQFAWDHSFPHKLVVGRDYPLNLYERMPRLVPVGRNVTFAKGGVGVVWLQTGWSSPGTWGTWSLGKQAVLSIEPETLPPSSGGMDLRLHANILVDAKHPVQQVGVAVDGKDVGRYVGKFPAKQLTMDIPIPEAALHSRRPIIISFSLPDAVSPAAISTSRDTRPLAIGLLRGEIVSPETGENKPALKPK